MPNKISLLSSRTASAKNMMNNDKCYNKRLLPAISLTKTLAILSDGKRKII